MPFKKTMRGLPEEPLAAKGLFYQDWHALTKCQRDCTTRLGMTIQTEQEAYLHQHPEIKCMLSSFVSKVLHIPERKHILTEAAKFFTRPKEELDQEIRRHMNLPFKGPYTKGVHQPYKFEDVDLVLDLKNIISKHYPPEPWKIVPTPVATPDTISSSFLSIMTSDTTLPTPEPVPTPEPTISKIFYALVSTTVDKAIYAHVDERTLLYDTAYVELAKAVEAAMEIPVMTIKEDIAQLYYNAYQMFELDIMEKERIAAEIAWEKRMRKKLKKTLRRQDNFKGYETPPTPRSDISSHESYKRPPPKPCICHPQFNFNRYAKDRFGIYIPQKTSYSSNNITATPGISMESIEDGLDEKIADVKSIISKKSMESTKSGVSKRD